ncbi:MAG: sulfite exporter TauE/SafE family protein [Elusimicrobia bacterium]|nr:sulfite exporter TauE/SafE family protein [Elusimicrobiota bacterium]
MFELTFLNFIIIAGFGFCIGIMGSVLGIGGGAFMVPFFVLLFKIPIHNAIAVSLIAIVALSSTVASVNVEKGLANMRLGVILEMLMVIGSITGALIVMGLDEGFVRMVFGFVLFPMSILMFMKTRKASRKKDEEIDCSTEEFKETLSCMFYDPSITKDVKYSVKNIFPASLISFFGGSLAGLLGIGGGIVQVPLMNLICKVPMKAAAATSNFMIGVSACASAFIFFRRGFVINELAGVIVIGVVFGALTGLRVLRKSKSHKIQMLFAALLFMAGIKMLMKSF